MRKFHAHISNLFDKFRLKTTDIELQQALIRLFVIFIGQIVLVITFFIGKTGLAFWDFTLILVLTTVYPLLIIASVKKYPGKRIRPYLTGLSDLTMLTLIAYNTGGPSSPFYLFYFWLILGYSIRYGRALRIHTHIISIIGYLFLIYSHDGFAHYPLQSITLLLILVVIPIHLGVLIQHLSRTREEADLANRAKSTFLTNMSHELRTPLNGIIGYSELLIEDVDKVGHIDSNNDLKNIRDAGKHLLDLINEMLDLSSIEAGRIVLHPENVDIQQLIDNVVTTVKPMIDRNRNTLIEKYDPDIGSMYTDPLRIRQILYNIISNAAKFTKDGEIIFNASCRQIKKRESVVFTITDTGIGMSNENLDRVFSPFTQADSSILRKYGGSGLGLTISKRFCELLGGTISVQSETEKGSMFSITLPVHYEKGKE